MWIPETNKIITTASVRFDSYLSLSTPPTLPIIKPSQSLKVLPFKPLVNRLAGAATPTRTITSSLELVAETALMVLIMMEH